jgi:hypothetical protein
MTKRTLITAVASLGLSLAMVAPAFAEDVITAPVPGVRPAHTTNMGGNSENSAKATAAISCVGAAVNTREQSLVSSVGTFTTALNAAHTARASALQQAYTNTTWKAVSAAAKSANAAFSSSTKSARTTWDSARKGAWSTFKTAAAACRPSKSAASTVNATVSSGV